MSDTDRQHGEWRGYDDWRTTPPDEHDPRDWRARAPWCTCGEGHVGKRWCSVCTRLAGPLTVNGRRE